MLSQHLDQTPPPVLTTTGPSALFEGYVGPGGRPPGQDPEAKWKAKRAAGQLPMQRTRQRYAARQREAKMQAKAAAMATAAAAAAAQQQQEQQKEAASAAAANPADAPRATDASEGIQRCGYGIIWYSRRFRYGYCRHNR